MKPTEIAKPISVGMRGLKQEVERVRQLEKALERFVLREMTKVVKPVSVDIIVGVMITNAPLKPKSEMYASEMMSAGLDDAPKIPKNVFYQVELEIHVV